MLSAEKLTCLVEKRNEGIEGGAVGGAPTETVASRGIIARTTATNAIAAASETIVTITGRLRGRNGSLNDPIGVTSHSRTSVDTAAA